MLSEKSTIEEEMLDLVEATEWKSFAKEIERLQKYETMIQMIANEPLELSWEKIQWQRNYWKELCLNLLKNDYPPNTLSNTKINLDDNF